MNEEKLRKGDIKTLLERERCRSQRRKGGRRNKMREN
jgi:hypothetical protein